MANPSATLGVIIVGDSNSPAVAWDRSRASVRAQCTAPFAQRECLAEELGVAIADIDAHHVLFLRAGDELEESALILLADAISRHDPPLIYGDEDGLGAGGAPEKPWFKPDWNREMFLGLDYISSAAVVRKELALRAVAVLSPEPEDPLLAMLLRASEEAGDHVFHLSEILVHVDRPDLRRSKCAVRDVQDHLGDRATCLPGPHETVHVQWPLPAEKPLVSIIIPTRDRLDLLEPCVASIKALTSYSNYELVIVDNGSVEQATFGFLEEVLRTTRARVIRSDQPYNYSALNNLAARSCGGQFLLLLNNDTEVISSDWLTEMLRHASRDHVGAVGAKLIYGDGSLQHAGVVVGLGEAAGHAHRNLPAGEPGYFRQPHVAQYVSAVSAACLLVSRERYAAVGGLDEEAFAVAFNDVDLCLKLVRCGWRNVYTPHAILYHHESKSRGDDLNAANQARYMRELSMLQARWDTKSFRDPFHHRCLDRYSETYVPDFFTDDVS